MICDPCQGFLVDFLECGIHEDQPFSKNIKKEKIRMITPAFTQWILSIEKRLQKEEFDQALITSTRIARRGRPLRDYEYLLQTATFNFLKYSVKWLESEVEIMKAILVDKGFIRGKKYLEVQKAAQEYIAYNLPRSLICLRDLHEDHTNPKGLHTDLNKFFLKRKQDEDDLYN